MTQPLDEKIFTNWFNLTLPACKSEDVHSAVQGFLDDIKTICPNSLFNKEVDEKAKKHFGASFTQIHTEDNARKGTDNNSLLSAKKSISDEAERGAKVVSECSPQPFMSPQVVDSTTSSSGATEGVRGSTPHAAVSKPVGEHSPPVHSIEKNKGNEDSDRIPQEVCHIRDESLGATHNQNVGEHSQQHFMGGRNCELTQATSLKPSPSILGSADQSQKEKDGQRKPDVEDVMSYQTSVTSGNAPKEIVRFGYLYRNTGREVA